MGEDSRGGAEEVSFNHNTYLKSLNYVTEFETAQNFVRVNYMTNKNNMCNINLPLTISPNRFCPFQEVVTVVEVAGSAVAEEDLEEGEVSEVGGAAVGSAEAVEVLEAAALAVEEGEVLAAEAEGGGETTNIENPLGSTSPHASCIA